MFCSSPILSSSTATTPYTAYSLRRHSNVMLRWLWDLLMFCFGFTGSRTLFMYISNRNIRTQTEPRISGKEKSQEVKWKEKIIINHIPLFHCFIFQPFTLQSFFHLLKNQPEEEVILHFSSENVLKWMYFDTMYLLNDWQVIFDFILIMFSWVIHIFPFLRIILSYKCHSLPSTSSNNWYLLSSISSPLIRRC